MSNVIRSEQKGPFKSTDGKSRKFTRGAEVDLAFLVKKHKEGIAKGRPFVGSRHDAVLGCVFHSLPTKELSGGFAEGRIYETGLITWIRGQSCIGLSRNGGGGGRTPNAVVNCGGSAWFAAGPTEEVVEARVATRRGGKPVRGPFFWRGKGKERAQAALHLKKSSDATEKLGLDDVDCAHPQIT
jgi:hypothetical protein